MGYAQAAGLPPITGLYATIVPLVAYAAFGPSRVMVLGPDSSLAAVIAAVILPLGGDDPETAVALAGALAVLTGLVILLAGIARLGFVTQLTPLVGAVAIAVLLVAAPGALQDLPLPMLAAIVITAAIGPDRRRRGPAPVPGPPLRVRPLAGRVRWGRPARGAGRHLRGHPAVAGRLRPPGLATPRRRAGREDELKGYHDIDRHPERPPVPGLLLYRFDAPLFFANAGYFVAGSATWSPRPPDPVRWVVVAAEPITDIDTTAADALHELLEELREQQVTLAFAELKGPVKDRLRRYGLYDAVGPDRFFPTIGTAVDGYVEATGTTWVDWEERPTPAPPG